ncbi:hypothetical protein A5766_19580 [Gordonia sp. 852002-51296_SCH5728562-b]|nr:hypothetical protein A5766_19580 [Gordonia sp. 852002-51296_SCH5728562-b]
MSTRGYRRDIGRSCQAMVRIRLPRYEVCDDGTSSTRHDPDDDDPDDDDPDDDQTDTIHTTTRQHGKQGK